MRGILAGVGSSDFDFLCGIARYRQEEIEVEDEEFGGRAKLRRRQGCEHGKEVVALTQLSVDDQV
jgi:hypothetical protein